MTVNDLFSKKSTSHPPEHHGHSSSNNKTSKKDSRTHHRKHKSKRIHTSFLDLLHWYQPAVTLDNNQQYSPHHRSIIKPTDFPRTVSKKSVTFGSVFDLTENEYLRDHWKSDSEITTGDPMSSDDTEEEDLVTFIPNKRTIDDIISNSDETVEPYPFRSETPLASSLRTSSLTDITSASTRTQKTTIDRFVHRRHPRKLRHPIKTTEPAGGMDRSTSTPSIPVSSELFSTTTKTTNNPQVLPLKTFRAWFKSSSVGRFVQSFGKHKQRKAHPASKTKKTQRQKVATRKLSDLIY